MTFHALGCLTQAELCFQFSDPDFQGSSIFFDVCGGEARSDILGAIPIVGNHLNEE